MVNIIWVCLFTFEEFIDEDDDEMNEDADEFEVFKSPVGGAAFVLKLFNRIGLCCCLWLSLAKDIYSCIVNVNPCLRKNLLVFGKNQRLIVVIVAILSFIY